MTGQTSTSTSRKCSEEVRDRAGRRRDVRARTGADNSLARVIATHTTHDEESARMNEANVAVQACDALRQPRAAQASQRSRQLARRTDDRDKRSRDAGAHADGLGCSDRAAFQRARGGNQRGEDPTRAATNSAATNRTASGATERLERAITLIITRTLLRREIYRDRDRERRTDGHTASRSRHQQPGWAQHGNCREASEGVDGPRWQRRESIQPTRR